MTPFLKEYGIPVFLVSFVIGVMAAAVFVAVMEARNSEACLAAGYPEARWPAPFGPVYCVKRVDLTDVVVPLSEVRR